MPSKKKKSADKASPTTNLDPAATAAAGEASRDGARKRRDPNQPSAVIGLGASAGGIAPLQQFFADMHPESKLAFVVVMHLSPDFESQLAAVIQQKTKMPVIQVSQPVKVRPNHVYVIPPNHQLSFVDSMLELVPPQQEMGRRVTIDLFFRTLAQAYGQRAVCVILSGTDSDGAIGLKHVRAQGGLTIAQDPNEAEFDSMPATAISTGMVDWVLPVARMPEKLLEFVRNEDRMQLPPEILEADDDTKEADAPGGETVSDVRRESEDEDALAAVLADVRAQTGHDFSNYKRATILRRVARRLQVNSLETIPQYLQFLRTHAAEGHALLQDLLIGVTHFFRDRDAFASLEAHVAQLFAGKKKGDEVRVWVAGCATGEEAYSIAMLLCEQSNRLDNPPSIQIFATDIDEESLADARQGLYPSMIEADVSPERLREFFVKDQGRYRVSKDVREKVLFAKHNLLTDAPFSRCDLISCRNLLIYLKGEAQRGVFDIFHFALRSGGMLFLGGAENDSAGQSLFSSIDNKHRIFVRRSTPRPGWRLPMVPARAHDAGGRRSGVRSLPALTQDVANAAGGTSAASIQSAHTRRETLFGELHLRLLEQYGPPSVVVNEAHEIVHLSESVGRYLRFVPGEPTANINRVIRSELQVEVRSALFKASQSRQEVMGAPVIAEIGEAKEVVTIEVRPMRATDEAAGFYLVLFHKGVRGRSEPAEPTSPDQVSREADEEIQFLKQQLASSVEQYEAANEELKASNEELQAMNEELRSASEELETSKEELQSVNEELITVNHELKSNIEELSLTNADLNNLMASTDLATVFLDRKLRILRFTPNAQRIFNLIPADHGRPISDITHRMNYEGLVPDLEKVLGDLHIIEHEVRFGDESEWYLARLAPYRASEDRIAGVVATFIKITERKRISEALRESEERFRAMFEQARVGIVQVSPEAKFLTVNPAFADMLGYSVEELMKEGPVAITHPEDVERETILAKKLLAGEIPDYTIEKRYLRKDGQAIWAQMTGALVRDAAGEPSYILGTVEAIDARKSAEEKLRLSEERFRQFAENSTDVFWILDAKTRRLEYINPVYEQMFGQKREVLFTDRKRRLELVPPEDQEEAGKGLGRALTGKNFVRNYRIVRPTDKQTRWIRDIVFPIKDEAGNVVRIAGVAQDITEDKEGAEALRESEEKLRLLIDGAPEYAMFLMDTSNHIIYWSKGAERVFGWTSDEAVGKSGEMIFTPEDRAREAEEKEMAIARKKGTAPDRRWHMRKDGSRIWVDGVMHRLDDEEGHLRGYAKIARNATEQRRGEEALQRAHDEMEQRVRERTRELTAMNAELERAMDQRLTLEKELLEISEREKRRIGEDLHDMVCQDLTATALFLKSSAKKVQAESEAASVTLEEAAQIVNRNVGLTRDLARGLQPAEMQGAGLKEALRTLAIQACEGSPGMKCHFRAARGVRVTDATVALHMFRVAQEAVKNAVKHSGAKNILIHLDQDAEKKNICVSVQDDGKGFSPKRRSKGLGLHIMRYRANALGGELKVEKRKTGGMDITCVVPLN